MNKENSAIRLSFRAYFIRLLGPESEPTVRVLLVESTAAQAIYEVSGSWPQCKRWITLISECPILADQLAAIHTRLELKRLAAIQEMRASLRDLNAAGFRRVDT